MSLSSVAPWGRWSRIDLLSSSTGVIHVMTAKVAAGASAECPPGNVASQEDRNAQCLEIACAHVHHMSAHIFGGPSTSLGMRSRRALDRDIRRAFVTPHRSRGVECGRENSGQRRDTIEQRRVENTYLFRRVARGLRFDVSDKQVVLAESQILRQQVLQRSREQSGANEQRQRHGDLKNDQAVRTGELPKRSARGFHVPLHGTREIMAAGSNGGRKSEQYSGGEGNQEREAEHRRVLGNVDWKAIACHPRKQGI